MAEIKITPELKAFMEKCNLNPFNPYAYAELAMRQQQQINEIAKNTLEEKVV